MHAVHGVWVGVCRLKCCPRKQDPETPVRRYRESRGDYDSYSIASAASDSGTPKTQTTMAARAQKEDRRLGELKLSEPAELVCWYS